ncbi:MAG TPA: F0F1 ATP synthase subunit B [Candidatus Paceibacterota bacterium]|nr:F0F1 ATP synthase subunit B [Candidatus Paceibacterota bacterium]HPT18137.1 F0F1 ATP synthase subunit B [Candidatus Paceibacterota bacterium]
MEELISTFHIDWKLMIAQLINFGLVFLALYFIAAKPLSKLISDRTKEITTGLDNAKKAESDVANANIKKEEIVKEAKENAKSILATSQADGKEIIKEAKEKASIEKEEIIKQAKLDAGKEKKNAEEEVRKEAGELIKDGVRKIMEGYVSEGKGEDIIKAMIRK